LAAINETGQNYAPIQENEIRGSRGEPAYIFKYIGNDLDVLGQPPTSSYEPDQPHDPILKVTDSIYAHCRLIYCPKQYEECNKNRHEHSEVGYQIFHCPGNIHLNGLFVINRDKYLCHDYDCLWTFMEKQPPGFQYGPEQTSPPSKADIKVDEGPHVDYDWNTEDGSYDRPPSSDEQEEEEAEKEKERIKHKTKRQRTTPPQTFMTEEEERAEGNRSGGANELEAPSRNLPADPATAIENRRAYLQANPVPQGPAQLAAVVNRRTFMAANPVPPGTDPEIFREHLRLFLSTNPVINDLLMNVFPEN
jgi:hypothetical protein